jgi:hypothetical protein
MADSFEKCILMKFIEINHHIILVKDFLII